MFELVDTHKTWICLNYKTLCDTTPIVLALWHYTWLEYQRPSYVQPRQIGKFDVIQNHVGRAVGAVYSPSRTQHSRSSGTTLCVAVWGNLINIAWPGLGLGITKREWGRVLTPLQIGCALLKKNSECVSRRGEHVLLGGSCQGHTARFNQVPSHWYASETQSFSSSTVTIKTNRREMCRI